MRSQGVDDESVKAALWKDRPESWHEVMKGVKRRILGHSPSGMMVLYRIEPKSVFPLHSHPHAQFGYFFEGGGEFKVGGSKWEMKRGDSYYVPPGMPHELKTGSEHCVLIDFFTPERLDYHSETLPPDSAESIAGDPATRGGCEDPALFVRRGLSDASMGGFSAEPLK